MPLRILGLIAVTLAGGCLPLLARRSPRVLHLLVALATGAFLGIVFLHLLPEALAGERDGLEEPWPGTLVLAGALALYLLQHLVLPGRDGGDPHVTASWGSFLGLGIHAVVAGLGLAAVGAGSELGRALFLSILVHKGAEGFSLATVFLLSGASRLRTAVVVGVFALATPAGYALGSGALARLSPAGTQAFTAVAAGTFLFVALGDLLPEVFHGRADRLARLLLLVLGIGAAELAHALGA
jgi:zinc transporter ZupT